MKDSVIALIESMRLARREMRWRRCRGLPSGSALWSAERCPLMSNSAKCHLIGVRR